MMILVRRKSQDRRQGSTFVALMHCQAVFHTATHSRAGGMVHEKYMWLLLRSLTE